MNGQVNVDQYYLSVIEALKIHLQKYLITAESDLELLVADSAMKNMTATQLKEILDFSLTHPPVFVTVNLYSTQASAHEERTYYLELQMGSNMIGEFIVPIEKSGTLGNPQDVKGFFEAVVKKVYEARKDEYMGLYGMELSEAPAHILNPYKKETSSMEKINKLNFKGFLGATSTNGTSSAEQFENTDGQTEELNDLSRSVDYLTEEAMEVSTVEDYSSEVIDFELLENQEVDYSVDISEDVLLDDFIEDFDEVLDEEEVELVTYDFEGLNEELNAMFKNAEQNDRLALKDIKADIWELEMKQDAEGLDKEDYSYLLQNVLSIETDSSEILKWQVKVVRQLLSM